MRFEDCYPLSHLRWTTENGRVLVRVVARYISTGRVEVEPVTWTHDGWKRRGPAVSVTPDELSRAT
jgi:hypothetical protein